MLNFSAFQRHACEPVVLHACLRACHAALVHLLVPRSYLSQMHGSTRICSHEMAGRGDSRDGGACAVPFRTETVQALFDDARAERHKKMSLGKDASKLAGVLLASFVEETVSRACQV